ncbi:MAG: hypothetical protein JXR03_03725 [Cyclobacteriaceae bacterium]
MNDLPIYISIVFIACIIAAFSFLYFAIRQTTKKGFTATIVLTFMSVWIFVIALLTFNDFFSDSQSMPPRIFMFAGTGLIIIIGLFVFKRTRDFIGKMPITTLTHIHIIRVPVEIVLWWLFLEEVVPQVITFEGMNHDILSGITAPFAGIFLVGLRSKSRIAAIIWNLVALGLLINVVSRAILASPYFYDPTVLDTPNIAILYFPFVFLPLFVVPAVLFSHLTSLYQLFFIKKEEY